MKSRIKAHLKKLMQVHGDFDHEVLDKNPLDMVSSMYNLSLQYDRDAVAYAKKQKITTMKEFRALVMKTNSSMVTALRAACKQDDAKQLSQAIEACIKDLTSEYFEMPTHIIVISTLYFLTETSTPEFAGKRRTAQTLIREALIAPLGELGAMYARAQVDGRPPREQQSAMVAARENLWHSPGVDNFGPLSPALEQNWVDLKNAVVHTICRQIIPKRTFEAARSDFTEGRWRHKEKQLVSEFEGEFMQRMDQLQLKCVHDDLDQASVMPCTRDCQKLFIGKIREDI